MPPLEAINFFVVSIVLFIISFVMNRRDTKTTPLERETMVKRIFPWWYYVFVFIGAVVIFGPFDRVVRLYGMIFMVATGLVGYNWVQGKNKTHTNIS